MASRIRNLTFDQGTDYTETFIVYESPSHIGASLDMNANWWANAQMRKSASHTQSALTFTTVLVHSGSSGTETVTISANNMQTSAVKDGRYLYEIVLTDPNSGSAVKTRVQEGIVTVMPSVELGSMYTINSTGYDVRSSYT